MYIKEKYVYLNYPTQKKYKFLSLGLYIDSSLISISFQSYSFFLTINCPFQFFLSVFLLNESINCFE